MDFVDKFIRSHELDVQLCIDCGTTMGGITTCSVCGQEELRIWHLMVILHERKPDNKFNVCSVCMEVLDDRLPNLKSERDKDVGAEEET